MPIPTNNHPQPAAGDAQQATAIFGSAYMGNVRYYAAMLAMRDNNILIDSNEKIGKHSWMHNHCRIMGANGIQLLTVPVEHVDTKCNGIVMRDLQISEHGDWRRIHWGAIFSAYGKTPFFEYIADDLASIYQRRDKWLIDFNMSLHNLIVDFLDLPVNARSAQVQSTPTGATDWRNRIGIKKNDNIDSIVDIPYYNIWNTKHGFTPGLSIIDLLMNCGRESVFILLKMLNHSLI